MQLSVYRHLWGLEHGDDQIWGAWLPRIAAAGYEGVEGMPPGGGRDGAFRAKLDELGLTYVAQVVTNWPRAGGTAAEHVRSFRQQLEAALPLRPAFVNAHSGVDLWDARESHAFLREARAIESDLGVLVTHETHRGRMFFNPRDTLALVDQHEGLSLCADLSHWVVVCERLLEDSADVIAAVAPRVRHVHARVGHPQGAQVSDPRAPEWAEALAAHERWWDAIWLAQESAGVARSTLTPEFGPPPYQQTLPFTCAPVADPWAISVWMADRQRARFADRFGRAGRSPDPVAVVLR